MLVCGTKSKESMAQKRDIPGILVVASSGDDVRDVHHERQGKVPGVTARIFSGENFWHHSRAQGPVFLFVFWP